MQGLRELPTTLFCKIILTSVSKKMRQTDLFICPICLQSVLHENRKNRSHNIEQAELPISKVP